MTTTSDTPTDLHKMEHQSVRERRTCRAYPIIAQADVTMVPMICSSASYDDFEPYAVTVEKHIHKEIKRSRMRLNYINELRGETERTKRDLDDNMADVTLPAPESTTSVDCTIMLSSMQDGKVDLLKKFLRGLTQRQRDDLLVSTVSARHGASFIQLALEFKHEEIFRMMRVYMTRQMKRRVTKSRDNLGNHSLHDACLENSLHSVQCLLANFTVEERQQLVMDTNDKGNNCLRLAASNKSSEVLYFLLQQFKSDDMLWQCIMQQNKEGITVGHTLASSSTVTAYKMFTMLCDVARRLNNFSEFLIQPDCPATLLHCAMNANASDGPKEHPVLATLELMMIMAKDAGCHVDLIWKRRKDEGEATALYYLASLKNMHRSVNGVCNFLLSQLSKRYVDNYIMATETQYNQNALHIAAQHENVSALVSLIKHLPRGREMEYFMVRSSNGSTPLHLAAAESAKTFKMLLDYLTVQDRHELILSKDSHGNTPILVAFIEGNIEVVNMLMKEEWVPRRMVFPLMSERNKYGWTIIHLSCMRLSGDSLTISVLEFLKNLPGVRLDAMIRHVDHYGNTVLHLAALLYRPGLIQSLYSTHLRSSEHRQLLLKQNKDGLRPSQLCNLPDLVVLRYLQPLSHLSWNNPSIMAKRNAVYKAETVNKMRELERKNGIQSTPVHTPDEDIDFSDLDFTHDF